MHLFFKNAPLFLNFSLTLSITEWLSIQVSLIKVSALKRKKKRKWEFYNFMFPLILFGPT